MKFTCPLIVVKDMEKAKQFYYDVLGLTVEEDFGTNAVLHGGLSMQTEQSWREMMLDHHHDVQYQGNDAEVCFEESDFDAFIEKLRSLQSINYVHEVKEHRWGQRVVRFYDLDHHIIEVGEDMHAVTKRFHDQGMTLEEIAERMDVSLQYVTHMIDKEGDA